MNEINNNSLSYSNLANNIFERAKYPASDIDIMNLAKNISLLGERGLTKLNRRLIEGGRKIWDTFSEHNFAVKLISQHDDETPISYEPEELSRPPDFKIVISGLTYWVQMKRLSNLERENRQKKFAQIIKMQAREVDIRKIFDCYISETFCETDIPEFMKFIAANAKQSIEGEEVSFPNDKEQKAKVDYWSPDKSKISYLTLGSFGDMKAVNETGLAKNQIKQSLKNASSAFTWDVDQYTINLVAIDYDKHNDIDICDALFGTEYVIDKVPSRGIYPCWNRENNGFFSMPDFSKKIAGVIAMRRNEPEKPVSNYFFMLFINDNFKDRIDDLNNLLFFNKVIYHNMRPIMGGNGYFELP